LIIIKKVFSLKAKTDIKKMKYVNPKKFSIRLSCEEIKLPPFEDVLVLGRRCPQGILGLNRSIELMGPSEFDYIEVKDDVVQAIFVNKRILKKISKEKLLSILTAEIFPYVDEQEILKIDITLKIIHESIEGEL
jgi:hypothetical protein